MKKRYYIYGLLVVVILFIAYHVYAGYRASQQLDKDIQKQVEQSGLPMSISYSAIDVQPFAGNILFSDLTVMLRDDIYRADTLGLDLGYFDFVNLYFGGTAYGLKHITDAKLYVQKYSSVNRQNLREIKFGKLDIHYQGQLLDALQTLLTPQPLKHAHTLVGDGKAFTYINPEAAYGSFRADSLRLHMHVPTSSKQLLTIGEHHLTLAGITWTPPQAFQQKWAFFMQGFQYQPDAIPLDSLGLHYRLPPPGNRIRLDSLMIYSELFTAKMEGHILLNDTHFARSALQDFIITFPRLSDTFENFLANIEQLLGFTIPRKNGHIYLQLKGTLAHPKIK